MDDMRIDGSAYREKFLDSFPLTETEVDGLVALYNATCQYDKGTSLMDCKRHLLNTKPMEQAKEEEQALNDLEQAISPTILNGILEASNHVAPLLPFDVPDDKTVPLCRACYFLEAMVSLLGRRGTRFLIHFVYNQTQQAAGEPTTAKALMEFLYQYLRATVLLTPSYRGERLPCNPPLAWIQSLLQKQQSAETPTTASISKQSWTTWINDTLPEATRCMSTLYHKILLGPNQPYGPTSPPPFWLPHPQPEPLLGLPKKNPLLPLTLACLSPALGKSWHCLYSSHRDGSSFLRFQQALLSYAGPTCLLIQPKQQQNTNNGSTGVFGYYTDFPWRESNTWVGGGGGDSFLFAYNHQHLGVYWPTYKGEQYMYLNTQPQNGMNHNHNNNKLRGLAIGGIDADTPRIHLTPSLERCQATATDTTYQSGPLLADDDSPLFDVDTLELWAVNFTTQQAFEHYQQVGQDHWTRREQARQRAATVDRAQFLDDFQSGAYLNGLYHHRDQARGRHDFVAVADGRHGYFLEGKPPSEAALTPRNTMDDDDGGEED